MNSIIAKKINTQTAGAYAPSLGHLLGIEIVVIGKRADLEVYQEAEKRLGRQ